jgi:hypothetical protein
MKALILSDEINQFHWSMLKSVLLVLSLLPMSQAFLNLWQSTEGSSQIMAGFFAISLFSALTLLSFWFALQATVLKLEQEEMSTLEHGIVQLYRYVPMLFLASMLSYLSLSV